MLGAWCWGAEVQKRLACKVQEEGFQQVPSGSKSDRREQMWKCSRCFQGTDGGGNLVSVQALLPVGSCLIGPEDMDTPGDHRGVPDPVPRTLGGKNSVLTVSL